MMVHGYGLMIGVAIVAAWVWVEKKIMEQGRNVEELNRVAWWVILGGIVGARAYHVIDYWDYYSVDWIRVLWVWEGGLAIWGAIVGGIMALLIRLKGKIRKTVEVMDVVVLGLPLAQVIGRIGNWINGELYGKNNEPLFAYEMALSLGLFIGLNFVAKNTHRGKMTGLYLMGYGAIRVLLEPLRPNPWQWGGVPVAIWFSGLAVIMGWLLWRKRP